MHIDLKWSNLISERMEMPIWQRWFCSVGSPCIAEAIHWSQHSHKVEKFLPWIFGVRAFWFCKVILKTSSVTKRLKCLCCKPTIYCRFVDILPRYDLFWWLVPAKRSAAWRAVMVHSARSIACLVFTQGPKNDGKIERRDGHHERNLQSMKSFLTLELSQYCKSGCAFSSSEPVAASSDCSWLKTHNVCAWQNCSPVRLWLSKKNGFYLSLAQI